MTTAPLNDATALLGNPAALRAQAASDGYLLIRGLLPLDLVEECIDALHRTLVDAGWIEPGRPLATARANLEKFCVEPQPAFMDVFHRQLSLRCLHALKLHPALLAVFADLFDETPFCPPHFVTRLAFPARAEYATPAHQDYVHFEGSRRNWAAWIPFTPVEAEHGGQAIAAGSHHAGAYDMRPALGAGQMVIDADLEELDWRWSPTSPGDVLIHNCLTVHRGLPNTSGSLRVSMDARYQPLAEPIGEKYLGVSHQQRTWDEIYEGWPEDEPLRYYWRDLDLDVVPFSYRWYDRRDERAIAMGEAGDGEALVALQNIALKHRDTTMRERAVQALARLEARPKQ